MATLAEIRRRIASLRNTQQITKAMEAVAASKLRRAQARALGARPYAERMSEVLSEVASRVSGFRHPFLETRPVQARLLILRSRRISMISTRNSVSKTERNMGIKALPSAAANPM